MTSVVWLAVFVSIVFVNANALGYAAAYPQSSTARPRNILTSYAAWLVFFAAAVFKSISVAEVISASAVPVAILVAYLLIELSVIIIVSYRGHAQRAKDLTHG